MQTMETKSPQARIRTYLQNDLGVDLASLADDAPLFTSGAIDSFALLELMAFLESEFHAKIELANLTIEQLDTIDALATLC
jgi:acyl carrier protein